MSIDLLTNLLKSVANLMSIYTQIVYWDIITGSISDILVYFILTYLNVNFFSPSLDFNFFYFSLVNVTKLGLAELSFLNIEKPT